MKTAPIEQAAVAISDEQAADLAALQAGAGVPAENLAGAEPAAIVPDLAGEITGLALAFVAMASPILPSLGRIYTPETTGAAAAAVAAVCEKHGWAQDGFLSEWGVEVGAAVVLIPLGIATMQGVKEDIAANKLKEQFIAQKKSADLTQHMNIAHNLDGKTEPVPTNAAGTVMFGEVMTGEN